LKEKKRREKNADGKQEHEDYAVNSSGLFLYAVHYRKNHL